MNLSSYIQRITEKELKRDGRAVTLFYGSKYQLLFFAQLFNFLKKELKQSVTCEDFTPLAKTKQFDTLRMSFLGNSSHYWFKDVSTCDKKLHQAWSQFVAQYAGPHHISFFVETKLFGSIYKKVVPHDCAVCLDDVDCAKLEFVRSCMYLNMCQDVSDVLVRKAVVVFRSFRNVSLDQIFTIIRYFDGTQLEDEKSVNLWLERLDLAPVSLFSLAEYFFSRKKRRFFALWARVYPLFPVEFWIVFWSEQIWQALVYCSMKQSGDSNVTKKNYNRLPFSFTQRDWRAYSLQELTRAHDALYLCDYRVKNGQSDLGLDVFIHKFFEKRFS